jgi:hypothetical protein
MLRTAAILLLLCACVARPSDDGDVADESSDEGSTSGDVIEPSPTSNATLDDSAGPTTTSATATDATDTNATDTDATDTVATATDTFTTGDPKPSFEVDIQPILDEHCVEGCHEPDGEWGFLLDMSGSAYDDLVDVMSPQLSAMNHVEPGDPESSYLWHKINGTQVNVGGSGLMMPKARPGMQSTVLTPEQFTAIEQWILSGAEP